MGYTTHFTGQINVVPPLAEEEISYLKKFAGTRRMQCIQGPYYVGRGGVMGQEFGSDVIKDEPPEGQPGRWCQWVPTADGNAIEWDGNEKFYDGAGWMKYLIAHFIGAHPLAQKKLPFLTGHTCNGEIDAEGEDPGDIWKLIVKDNRVYIQRAVISFAEAEEVRPRALDRDQSGWCFNRAVLKR